MKTSGIEAPEPRPRCDAGFVKLFLLFSKIGLSSFGGGVSVWMHTALVERRGWLHEPEFSSALALARIMPGVNIVNLAILIGHRLTGFSGAVAAVAGLLVGPSLVAIATAVLYRHFAGTMIVDVALAGTAASAAGLLIAMGAKSGGQVVRRGLASKRRTAQGFGTIVVFAATFALVGVLRFPTVPTVLCLTPCAIALAWFGSRRPLVSREHHGG
jgi:chromate transporter